MTHIYIRNYCKGLVYIKLKLVDRKTIKVIKFIKPLISGWYSDSPDGLIMIYRIDENLYLNVKNKEYFLNNEIVSCHLKINDVSVFSIELNNSIIFKIQYKPLSPKWPDYDEYIQDFFLSLHYIISTPESWSDCFRGAMRTVGQGSGTDS